MRLTLRQSFLNFRESERIMNRNLLFLALFLALSMSACSAIEQNNQANSCPFPANFQEQDVIGTWKTGLPERNDTLIFREDMTYKQIVHVRNPAFDYESDWLPWSLKISESGVPYLYLEEMRLCVYWEGVDCQKPGGGKDDWYDFCKKEWVQMPNEGILIVLGPPKGIKLPPPGISLFALKRSTEGTTVYDMQVP